MKKILILTTVNFFWNTFIQMWCLLLAVRIYKPCEGKPEIWSWTLEGFKHQVKMSVANSFLLDRYLEELKHNMANSGKGKLPKTLYWMWNFFSYNWFVSWSYFNSFVLWSCSATVLLQLLFSRKIVMCVFLWETVSVFVKIIGQMKNKVESTFWEVFFLGCLLWSNHHSPLPIIILFIKTNFST